MKIIFERSKCIGCGSCESVCPEFFEMGQDNLADLKGAKQEGDNFELEIEGQAPENLKEAVDICPLKIIRLT